MSSTEPSTSWENTLVFIQHFSGVVLLAFNGFIILLIIFDGDQSNRKYRKYLCCLQISSLAFDTFSDFYSPIFIMHKGLGYSDSTIARWISFGKYIFVEVFLFFEVILAYFACVYFRRGFVLGPESLFNYRGRRRTFLFLSVQLYGFAVLFVMTYFMQKSLDAAEKLLPSEVDWVRKRATYLFILPDENLRYYNYVATPAAALVAIPLMAMLGQLIFEVKKGSKNISTATRRYQRLAVRSLLLQGAVPSLVYVIPAYANTCLQFAPSLFDTGEIFDNFATVLSPICWIFITKHTFATSLTILYCSPSYRIRFYNIITRNSNPKNIEVTGGSQLTL